MVAPIKKGGKLKVTVDAEHRKTNGELIARSVTIDPPDQPTCISPKCIMRFMLDSLYIALLSSYHSRRVAYAEANRNKKILERYRTGEPAPKNLWQAIHANLKLKCHVCRKYNVDPLLFGGKNNEPNGRVPR